MILLIVVVIIIMFVYYCLYDFRLKRICQFLSINDKILDLGCGSCCLTQKIKDKGYNIVGIDVVNESKCYNPVIFDGKVIPFNDKSFDVTICAFVLHHIVNCEDMLDEMIRVTKKYILIFEDTPSCDIDQYLCSQHAKSHWGTSNCFKNIDEWLKVFNKKGLRVVKIDPLGRLESPFARKPYIYPVNKTFFCVSI